MTEKRPAVLCFGEVLWDCLPHGRFLGGAPLNVAYHLAKLGCLAWPVSSVGDDAHGRELVNAIRSAGVPVDLIGVRGDRQTGTVTVTLDDGSPSYDIVEDVAWDYIDVPQRLPDACQPVAALVYGSLAQRGQYNRRSLEALLGSRESAFRVFDVNRRPPFDSPRLIWHLAATADLIKLNDEEAAWLLEHDNGTLQFEQAARAVAARSRCDAVCITGGARGAGLLVGNDWYRVDAAPAAVRDTVGAGDSFLAALVHGMLTSPGCPDTALRSASRLAAFVAGSDGATPEYSVDSGGRIR